MSLGQGNSSAVLTNLLNGLSTGGGPRRGVEDRGRQGTVLKGRAAWLEWKQLLRCVSFKSSRHLIGPNCSSAI